MAKWSYRSGIYKVTLLLTYFIFLVYGLAFALPTWFGRTVAFQGLWVHCTGSDEADFSDCTDRGFGEDFDWTDGVRGVWLGGMFFFVMAVLYSLVENCCSSDDNRDYGVTGVLVLLAGLCGAAGIIVVAVEIEELNNDPEEKLRGVIHYYWGYMLACIASGLAIILAIILLITCNTRPMKEKHRGNGNRTADYVFAHKPASPYYPEYTNQGYNRDVVPLANGVTYHHTPSAHPYTMYQGGYAGGNNSLPHPRNQGMMYGGPTGYQAHGYDMNRSMQHHSMADSADLSNGYTTELINAEHSLSRTNLAQRGDFGRVGDYGRNDFAGRNDYYLNGSRPY